jgi:regulator of sirC expression with transglutaminase-like and TPR domain
MERKRMLRRIFLILIASSSFSFAQQRIDSTLTIEKILALPEDEIDIGLADLVLAKDFYPNLRIEPFLYAFDCLANQYNKYFARYTDPEQRVRSLNTFLYQKGIWNDSVSFCYDDDDLKVTKLSNKFINGYISTKKGSCITLPMMYIVLAERLGFPIYASRLPYHFFVRYIPEKKIPKFQENIEATNGGSYVSNKEYKQNFLVPDKALKNGVYLRTLTKKQYIASLLLVNADEWILRKNLEKAKYYLELSMRYDSTFSSAYMNYGLIHFQEARQLEEKLWDEKQTEIAYFESSKNRVINPTPKPILNQPKLPEPDYNTFQVQVQDNLTKKNPLQQPISPKEETKPPVNPDLQISLAQIEQKYEPLIKAKIEVYHRYKQKAEDLGIIRGYPLDFFKNQSDALKHYQEKGAK